MENSFAGELPFRLLASALSTKQAYLCTEKRGFPRLLEKDVENFVEKRLVEGPHLVYTSS